MPRFFFHLEDGHRVRDEEGLVVESADAARAEAIRAAREIMSDEIKQGRLSLADRILIDDESGNAVMTVPFADAVDIEGPPHDRGR